MSYIIRGLKHRERARCTPSLSTGRVRVCGLCLQGAQFSQCDLTITRLGLSLVSQTEKKRERKPAATSRFSVRSKGEIVDRNITAIISKALEGQLLDRKEIIELLSVDQLSPEAFAIQQAGRAFTSALCEGEAEIHAHIGLDAAPCPMDCRFCSFAVSNSVFDEHVIYPMEKVLADAREFEEQGANALYLVTTVLYGRDRFLETVEQIKSVLKTDVPLVANIPDFDRGYARELAALGVKGVYHVIRLGEEKYTRCNIERRKETMRAAKEAGLALGNCIEPIGPEHSPEELADLIMLAREFEVAFSGAMRRNTVSGSVFEKFGNIPYSHLATYAGAIALATGEGIPGNCTHEPSQVCAQAGANIMWASRGTDPRDTQAETSRGYSIGQVRDMYFETAWNVRKGPSRFYA